MADKRIRWSEPKRLWLAEPKDKWYHAYLRIVPGDEREARELFHRVVSDYHRVYDHRRTPWPQPHDSWRTYSGEDYFSDRSLRYREQFHFTPEDRINKRLSVSRSGYWEEPIPTARVFDSCCSSQEAYGYGLSGNSRCMCCQTRNQCRFGYWEKPIDMFGNSRVATRGTFSPDYYDTQSWNKYFADNARKIPLSRIPDSLASPTASSAKDHCFHHNKDFGFNRRWSSPWHHLSEAKTSRMPDSPASPTEFQYLTQYGTPNNLFPSRHSETEDDRIRKIHKVPDSPESLCSTSGMSPNYQSHSGIFPGQSTHEKLTDVAMVRKIPSSRVMDSPKSPCNLSEYVPARNKILPHYHSLSGIFPGQPAHREKLPDDTLVRKIPSSRVPDSPSPSCSSSRDRISPNYHRSGDFPEHSAHLVGDALIRKIPSSRVMDSPKSPSGTSEYIPARDNMCDGDFHGHSLREKLVSDIIVREIPSSRVPDSPKSPSEYVGRNRTSPDFHARRAPAHWEMLDSERARKASSSRDLESPGTSDYNYHSNGDTGFHRKQLSGDIVRKIPTSRVTDSTPNTKNFFSYNPSGSSRRTLSRDFSVRKIPKTVPDSPAGTTEYSATVFNRTSSGDTGFSGTHGEESSFQKLPDPSASPSSTSSMNEPEHRSNIECKIEHVGREIPDSPASPPLATFECSQLDRNDGTESKMIQIPNPKPASPQNSQDNLRDSFSSENSENEPFLNRTLPKREYTPKRKIRKCPKPSLPDSTCTTRFIKPENMSEDTPANKQLKQEHTT